MLAVAEAYFFVQQARGELAGAEDLVRRTEELVRRADKLAPGLIPPAEAARARTELSRRRQAVHSFQERWRSASADLVRVLRLDPAALVEPLEPPHLQVTLVSPEHAVDDLIPIALTNRPELESQQALVQATLQRLRQERLRPLIPSVLVRGGSTNPAGTLGGGYFGGGRNDDLSRFDWRLDVGVQVVWEWQNLGFGNVARVNERRAENQLAVLELFRAQDRIAAEVVQAHAQAQSAAARVREAEAGVKDAVESADKNFEGMGQTKRLGGDVILLLIRPQEVVASLQALGQAYSDYYKAVADYDQAQFRLFRALGQPAQRLAAGEARCEAVRPVEPPCATRCDGAPDVDTRARLGPPIVHQEPVAGEP
jgi:outer membrane protein TolC